MRLLSAVRVVLGGREEDHCEQTFTSPAASLLLPSGLVERLHPDE
jgi:hypothetical protein